MRLANPLLARGNFSPCTKRRTYGARKGDVLPDKFLQIGQRQRNATAAANQIREIGGLHARIFYKFSDDRRAASGRPYPCARSERSTNGEIRWVTFIFYSGHAYRTAKMLLQHEGVSIEHARRIEFAGKEPPTLWRVNGFDRGGRNTRAIFSNLTDAAKRFEGRRGRGDLVALAMIDLVGPRGPAKFPSVLLTNYDSRLA